MPQLNQGSNVTLTLNPSDSVTIVANGGEFKVEYPAGTLIAAGGADQTFGPYPNGGSFKITANQGNVQYEQATQRGSLGNVYVDSDGTLRANGVIAGTAPYLGQTFTRSFPSNTFNGGITRGMSRSFHICRATSVNPTATYYNGRMNNAVETAGQVGTIDCSLEYPVGVFTRANECIVAGGPVPFPAGGTVDLTFNVTVPKNAVCFLRPMQRCAGGINWCQAAGGSTYGVSPDDFMDIGTSDSIDKVMGGTIGASNGINFFPIFFGAMTTQPSVLILGTSREAGGVGVNNDITCDLGPVARTVGPRYGYSSYALSGTLLANWNAGSHTALYSLISAGRFTHIVNEYGVNDIPSDTAAQLAARHTTFGATIKALRPTIKIIGMTLYPYVTSSDAFVTKANQAPGANQPKLFTYNNLVRAGITGQDDYWEAADALDPYRTGQYTISRNPNDTTRTPASVTGGISGTTLTVSAVGAGFLNVGDPLYDAGGLINDSTWIVGQLSGTTGGIGTYQVSKAHSGFPTKNAVAGGTTITTAGYITRDGLHAQWFGEEQIVAIKGPALLAKIA